MNITESYKKRIQELAGVDFPKAEIKTFANGFKELNQILGNDSVNKIINYIRTNLKKSFVILSVEEDKITFSSPNKHFLIFRGYMDDSSSYLFNIGYTNKLGEQIFTHQLFFDTLKTPCNLKSMDFNKPSDL